MPRPSWLMPIFWGKKDFKALHKFTKENLKKDLFPVEPDEFDFGRGF